MPAKIFIVGGAGFIGSHFVHRLLNDTTTRQITIYDNFTSGREWHYAEHASDPRLNVVRGDVKDSEPLERAMRGHDLVIHLASNPDISKAMTDPDIDFREGTLLTRQVVEAMRVAGVPSLLYASGSGVYGDIGMVEAKEDYSPMLPSSTYGASKLSGEAIITAYCAMFGLRACAFRFGNVVGPHQTHGVGFDFVKRLLSNPTELRILGDGSQSKSYVYIEDIIDAVLLAHAQKTKPFEVYNVATGDYITVKEIAEIAVEVVGLPSGSVKFVYTGGDRGWKGDVPIVRLNTDRIRLLGWKNRRTAREAIRDSMKSMLQDAQAGRL